MRFLTDQDVYGTTVLFLSGLGHEVVPAAKLGLAQADDAKLLRAYRSRFWVRLPRPFSPTCLASNSSSSCRNC